MEKVLLGAGLLPSTWIEGFRSLIIFVSMGRGRRGGSRGESIQYDVTSLQHKDNFILYSYKIVVDPGMWIRIYGSRYGSKNPSDP